MDGVGEAVLKEWGASLIPASQAGQGEVPWDELLTRQRSASRCNTGVTYAVKHRSFRPGPESGSGSKQVSHGAIQAKVHTGGSGDSPGRFTCMGHVVVAAVTANLLRF
jgi:hypothetical protein